MVFKDHAARPTLSAVARLLERVVGNGFGFGIAVEKASGQSGVGAGGVVDRCLSGQRLHGRAAGSVSGIQAVGAVGAVAVAVRVDGAGALECCEAGTTVCGISHWYTDEVRIKNEYERKSNQRKIDCIF